MASRIRHLFTRRNTDKEPAAQAELTEHPEVRQFQLLADSLGETLETIYNLKDEERQNLLFALQIGKENRTDVKEVDNHRNNQDASDAAPKNDHRWEESKGDKEITDLPSTTKGSDETSSGAELLKRKASADQDNGSSKRSRREDTPGGLLASGLQNLCLESAAQAALLETPSTSGTGGGGKRLSSPLYPGDSSPVFKKGGAKTKLLPGLATTPDASPTARKAPEITTLAASSYLTDDEEPQIVFEKRTPQTYKTLPGTPDMFDEIANRDTLFDNIRKELHKLPVDEPIPETQDLVIAEKSDAVKEDLKPEFGPNKPHSRQQSMCEGADVLRPGQQDRAPSPDPEILRSEDRQLGEHSLELGRQMVALLDHVSEMVAAPTISHLARLRRLLLRPVLPATWSLGASTDCPAAEDVVRCLAKEQGDDAAALRSDLVAFFGRLEMVGKVDPSVLGQPKRSLEQEVAIMLDDRMTMKDPRTQACYGDAIKHQVELSLSGVASPLDSDEEIEEPANEMQQTEQMKLKPMDLDSDEDFVPDEEDPDWLEKKQQTPRCRARERSAAASKHKKRQNSGGGVGRKRKQSGKGKSRTKTMVEEEEEVGEEQVDLRHPSLDPMEPCPMCLRKFERREHLETHAFLCQGEEDPQEQSRQRLRNKIRHIQNN